MLHKVYGKMDKYIFKYFMFVVGALTSSYTPSVVLCKENNG